METQTRYPTARTRTWWATWVLTALHLGGGIYQFLVLQEDLSWRWNAVPGWLHGFLLSIDRDSAGVFTISPPPEGWNVFDPERLNICGVAGGNLEGPGIGAANAANLTSWYDSETDTIQVCVLHRNNLVDGDFSLRLHWYFTSSTVRGAVQEY